MDETRRDIEAREEAQLSIFGRRSARAARSRPLDPEGRLFDYRTEFQRDRDRILHARAFRRLRLKAEGGGSGPSDRHRDRLTHTLEVAQIARTLSRALELNEDLTEAIALGHALGSPPFGRDGERALDTLLRRSRPPLPGGFRTSLQSLRVVDLLEKRYDHPGLNLTLEVRAGIARQAGGAARPARAGASRPRRAGPGEGSILSSLEPELLSGDPPSPEAQACARADRFATALGDLDDALRAGEIELGLVERLPIVKVLLRHLGGRYPAAKPGRVFVKANQIHRGLTHLLVTSTIQHSRKTLRGWARKLGITTHEEFLAAEAELPAGAIGPDPRTARLFEGLVELLGRKLPATAEAAAASTRAAEILGALFRSYCREPRLLDDYVLIRFKEVAGGAYLRDLPAEAMETEIARRYHASGAFQRLVADHLAGMTDAYACSEYSRLLGPVPSPGGGLPFR